MRPAPWVPQCAICIKPAAFKLQVRQHFVYSCANHLTRGVRNMYTLYHTAPAVTPKEIP